MSEPNRDGFYSEAKEDSVVTEPLQGREFMIESSPAPVEDNLISHSLDMMDWIQDIQSRKAETNFEKLLSGGKKRMEEQTFFSKLMRNVGVTFTGRKFIEITEIEIVCEQDSLFWSGNIDSLGVGDKLYGAIATASGWVLGRAVPITMVRLATTEMGIADTALNVSRPDVRTAYSFATTTDITGFSLMFNFDILPKQGMLQLQAIFADSQVVPFAFIKYQKYSGFLAR